MKAKPLPSQERLQELFDYNVITGKLIRKVKTAKRVHVGDEAGTVVCSGKYKTLVVNVDKVRYKVPRLIWRLVTGEDPGDLEIDHINMDPFDNSWHNLRLATHSQNNLNRKCQSNSGSGYKGVFFYPVDGTYKARIYVDGHVKYLGNFDTPEKAHAAYCEAAHKLHGQFARTQ